MTGEQVERRQGGNAGPQGKQGEQGRSFSRRQMVVMYGIMLSLFFLLAWRTEVNQNGIRATAAQAREYAISNCNLANKNALAINSILDLAIESSRANLRKLPEAEVKRNIAAVEAAKAKQAECPPR